MNGLTPRNSVLNRVLFFVTLLLFCCTRVSGQESRHYLSINLPKQGFTGVCLAESDSLQIRGTIVNEFGIKALDFVYDKLSDQIRMPYIVKNLDKWYLRKVLKRDLKGILPRLCENSAFIYEGHKRKMTYNFVPLPPFDDETAE